MKVNDLLLEIEIDKEWRLLELERIENICQNLSSDDDVRIVLKSILPLIYSHWEGYVVSSLRKLHNWLTSLNYPYSKFTNSILTVSYEEYIKNLMQSEIYSKKEKHLEIIISNFSNNVVFPPKINVKSNVSFEIIKSELCMKYNFSLNNFAKFEKDLNTFINLRNKIAHGELGKVEFESYSDIQKYVDLLSDLMDTLNLEISNFCQNKLYLRRDNGQSI